MRITNKQKNEIDDLNMCRAVIKILMEKGKSIDFTMFEILEIIEENPKLMNINKNVQQKEV